MIRTLVVTLQSSPMACDSRSGRLESIQTAEGVGSPPSKTQHMTNCYISVYVCTYSICMYMYVYVCICRSSPFTVETGVRDLKTRKAFCIILNTFLRVNFRNRLLVMSSDFLVVPCKKEEMKNLYIHTYTYIYCSLVYVYTYIVWCMYIHVYCLNIYVY